MYRSLFRVWALMRMRMSRGACQTLLVMSRWPLTNDIHTSKHTYSCACV